MRSECWVVQRGPDEPGFVTRRIAGETIVVPVSSRVGDLDAIYTFNEVGSTIWSLIEKPSTVDAIVARLTAVYDAPREQIMTDVLELLDTLEDKGLIRTIEAPGV
jgi:hypothetical protein